MSSVIHHPDIDLPMNHEASLQQLMIFFETLSPATCADLGKIYTEDAYFKDPFNEVQGITAISHLFEHMFVQVDNPRFEVKSTVLQGEQAFLCWDFLFNMKRFNTTPQCIQGATHIRFADDGRVCMHRDYWDAAEELYEKLPVLGSFMRFLKRAARQ